MASCSYESSKISDKIMKTVEYILIILPTDPRLIIMKLCIHLLVTDVTDVMDVTVVTDLSVIYLKLLKC